jgi:hypothetical protein
VGGTHKEGKGTDTRLFTRRKERKRESLTGAERETRERDKERRRWPDDDVNVIKRRVVEKGRGHGTRHFPSNKSKEDTGNKRR